VDPAKVLTLPLLLTLASTGCVPQGTIDVDTDTTDDPTEAVEGVDTDDSGDATTEEVPPVEEPLPGEEIFDEAEVPVFVLTLPESSMQALRDDPRTYAPGAFTYGDLTLEPIGVRTKGSGTWQPIDAKPSLKIKFDEYDEELRFMKMSEITLNNMVSDYSMMHERVAYRVFREAGVPASRAHHTWLELNGQAYGLYTHVESATKTLIQAWYDDDGTMWEFTGGEFESAYIDDFSQKFGEDDRTPLTDTTQALVGDGAFEEEVLEQSLDLDVYLSYWAACAWTAHYDGYPYRYPGDDAYVYFDPDSEQLKFMPHGVDETFYYYDWDPADNVISRLGWKCLATPTCKQQWAARSLELADELEALDLGPWLEDIRQQIAPLVAADTRKPYSNANVTAYQDFMVDMVEARRSQIQEIFGGL